MKHSKKSLPFMSVVVVAYNGETTVGRAIESLLAQDYPKKRYEIIVINDGSTDKTSDVASSYKGVRVYSHYPNRGISEARNAGIAHVKGDLYVSFDCDCIAHPDWLKNLAKGYKHTDVAGVGGIIMEPETGKGLARNYIAGSGFGFPPLAHSDVNRGKPTLWKRIVRYAKDRFMLPEPPDLSGEAVVEELYGANGSYPIEILKTVKGWDTSMSGIEDRDICRRIRNAYPGKRFYAEPDARIDNDPDLTLWQYLRRPLRRGFVNWRFHRTYHLLPPLFPFPFAVLLAATYAGYFHGVHVITILLLAPQLLYMRWPLRFLKTKKPGNLLFPYIQMFEESLVIVGLVRGAGISFKLRHPLITRWLRPSLLFQLALIGGWFALAAHAANSPLRALGSLAFLLAMPGYLLLRTIIGYKRAPSILRVTTYSIGLSLVSLMLLGLMTNELFVALHKLRPLSTQPLAWSVGGFTLLAALIANSRKPLEITEKVLSWKLLKINLWRLVPALLLPFMAVGGALTLNNGGSPRLAGLTMLLISCYTLYLVWRRHAKGADIYPWALYGITLAVLLGTSMRGWFITGHDVMQEYQVFQLTLQHAAWHMSYYQDAYNACLSITILPTLIQQLTGISDPFVYKFAYQLFFAAIAPIMYGIFRRYVGRRTAFLAAFVCVTFPTFLTDITMLNRQETALLCFALAVQAGLDKTLRRKQHVILVTTFLTGMVLSHYSTSYVASAVLIIIVGLYIGLRIARRLLSRWVTAPVPRLDLIPLRVIVIVLILLTTWGSLVTQTSGNISKTLSGVITNLPALLDGTAKPDNYSKTGATATGDNIVKQYLDTTTATRKLPAASYYPKQVVDTFSVAKEDETVSPVRPKIAKYLSQSTLYGGYEDIKKVYALLIEALIGVGIMAMLLVKRWRKTINGQYRLLIVASLLVIGIQVVLPASLVNYGLLRVIQQSLLVLSLPIVLACYWMMGVVRIRNVWRPRLLAVALVGFYAMLSGLLPYITGGYKPALALSNSGFYYDAYYTHANEIAADQWLIHSTPKGSRVYSDEFARRKTITYSASQIFPQPFLAPGAIPIDSYVLLDDSNTRLDTVPAYYNGNLIYYQLPLAFLNQEKSLVYSSKDVEIYR